MVEPVNYEESKLLIFERQFNDRGIGLNLQEAFTVLALISVIMGSYN
jgi:hypothetical protein